MKRMFLLPLLMVGILFTSCDKEKVVSESDLPKDAQSFLKRHYNDHDVLQVVKDRDDWSVTYEVMLSNGSFLEFNRKGECEKIEGTEKIPNGALDGKIVNYVNTNYSSEIIIQWELEDRGQEIELSNGLELDFDKNGKFLRIDS